MPKLKPGDRMRKYFEETVRIAIKYYGAIDEQSAMQCFDIADKRVAIAELQDDLKNKPVKESKIDISESNLLIDMFLVALNDITNAKEYSEAVGIAKYALSNYELYLEYLQGKRSSFVFMNYFDSIK